MTQHAAPATVALAGLALAGLLAFAPLQSASGQAANQDVTIKVEEVEQISVGEDVSLGPFNQADIENENARTANTTYSVLTNTNANRVVTAAITSGSSTTENNGTRLRVEATQAPNEATSEGSQTLTSLGSGTASFEAKTIVTGISDVDANDLDLEYEAAVDAGFDPSTDATFTVEYTLTSQN